MIAKVQMRSVFKVNVICISIIFLFTRQNTPQMPFKLKLIREFQKTIKAIKNQPNDKPQNEEQKENTVAIRGKGKPCKKLLDKNFNFFQLIYKREPNENHHVVNFYNIIGLNQKAIAEPEFEESKFTTIFYIKNVKKVQIKTNVLTMQLCNAPIEFPPVQYIIERYKSFGDRKFYNLAMLLQEASSRLKSIQELKLSQNFEDSSDFFQKYVESLGNKMFVCRSTANKLVISKSLLNLLQYNPEDMAIEIIKYKAPLFEIFSAEHYFDVITKMIENLKNLFDLISDKISLETFLNSSLIRFKDYLITKNHKKIYCKLKVGMPNPMVNLMEIEEVLFRSQESQFLTMSQSFSRMSIKELKNKREIEEISTIRRIMPLPKNLLPENQQKVTSYCPKQEEQKAQSIDEQG